jgi:hypothetical protein
MLANFMLHRVFLYIQYIDQQMHVIKYNKLQIMKHNSKYYPYMFRQQSAIFRESNNTCDFFHTLSEDGTLVLKHVGELLITVLYDL